jgi:hypothetical protein
MNLDFVLLDPSESFISLPTTTQHAVAAMRKSYGVPGEVTARVDKFMVGSGWTMHAPGLTELFISDPW